MQRSARWLGLTALLVGIVTALPAKADALQQAKAAFSRGHYGAAAQILMPIARRGNPRAQAMLGFMHENGLGAPQAYDVAAEFYHSAAERGDPSAQYLLGLLYDKGHGVARDEVLAYKWLDLAAAAASARDRDHYLNLRNAVASKMSLAQVVEGQRLALRWRAKR